MEQELETLPRKLSLPVKKNVETRHRNEQHYQTRAPAESNSDALRTQFATIDDLDVTLEELEGAL